jgi:membrane-bound lytic murein transglycosylase D
MYKAKKGDTVVSVAEHFGVPEEKLRSWNHVQGDKLASGQLLKVYLPVKGKTSGVINTQAPSKKPKKGGKSKGKSKAKGSSGKHKAKG